MAATLARKPTAGWERWGSRSRSVSGQCQTRHRGTLPGQHQGHTAGSYAEACSAGRAVTTAGPAAGRGVGVPPCRRADIPRRWPVQKPEARTSQHQPPPPTSAAASPRPFVFAPGGGSCAGQAAPPSLRARLWPRLAPGGAAGPRRPHRGFVQIRTRCPFIGQQNPTPTPCPWAKHIREHPHFPAHSVFSSSTLGSFL